MPRSISTQHTAFLESELKSNEPRRQKNALQDICFFYRNGFQFRPETRNTFELIIAGITVNSYDDKVVRWCLNAIARLGTRDLSGRSVEVALKRHETNMEIVAAAMSALAFLYRGQIPELRGIKAISPEVQILAAMQTVSPRLLELRGLAIDISRADAEILKLALIVVGINKDIQNLLHPRHENGDIVRALGQHDDRIVRQYSVWAVIENRFLSIEHLGVEFGLLEKQPPNVQSKMLQLGAGAIENLRERQELIIRGSNLSSENAREGLSRGLATTFYDGLQDATIPWFESENSRRVQLRLAEHFARYSEACPSYYELAMTLAERDLGFRERVLLGGEGRRIFGVLKRREIDADDLFSQLDDTQQQQLIERIKMRSKTNVLILSATPRDQDWIRPDKEGAALEEALEMVSEPQRPLRVIQKFGVRLNQIQKELLNNRPRILQFNGHGSRGELVFETREGASAPLSGEVMASIVSVYGELECIVLHACYTEEVAEACAKHVGTVIGSSSSVTDQAANSFTVAFYQALAHGRPYRNAFEMGRVEVSTIDPGQAQVYRIFDSAS